MIFKFHQKGLFIIAGVICLLSFFLAPVALVFFYMAAVAKIEIDDTNFTYRMLTKKIVPFAGIRHIMLGKPTPAYYRVGYTTVTVARVVPLVILYNDNKKIKLSLNAFGQPEQILEELLRRTNLEVEEYKPSLLFG